MHNYHAPSNANPRSSPHSLPSQVALSNSSHADVFRALYLPAGLFGLVFSSKLMLIHKFGHDLPFWDQWNTEGQQLYKPFLQHGLTAIDWIAQHNEHRVLFTRLTALGLFWLNSGWDPLVEVVFNAALHSALAALLLLLLLRGLSSRLEQALAATLVAAGTSLPFAWENTLWGFQNQFYFLLALSILLFWLCSRPLSWGAWIAVCLISALVPFTMGSGGISCLIAALMLGYRYLYEQRQTRLAVLAFLCLSIGITALATTKLAASSPFYAPSAFRFFEFLLGCIGWPLPPYLAPVVWIPTALALVTFRLKEHKQLLFWFGVSAFVLANAAILAYTRGRFDPQSKYLDIMWLGWLSNIMILSFYVNRIVMAGAVAIAVCALTIASVQQYRSAEQRGADLDIATQNVARYIQTRDISALTVTRQLHIPYYDRLELANYLDDNLIRSILPPSINPYSASKGRLRDIADGILSTVNVLLPLTLVLFLSATIAFPMWRGWPYFFLRRSALEALRPDRR